MWIYVLSLVAALLVGGASVIQQRAAAQAPPEHNLSPRLLVWLAQRPLWLAGAGCAILGNLVFALSVGRGNVALAEALLVVRLLFALPLAAAWGRHSVPARDWGGAVALTGGLIGFILAAQPQKGTGEDVANSTWLIGGGIVAGMVLATTAIARRRGPTRKATLLAAGAGALFGLQASLTHSAFDVLGESGVVGLLTTWNGYAVLTVAAFGTLLLQSAYESAPLPASYPAEVTVELLAGIAVGVGVLGGEVDLTTAGAALGLLCLLVMVGGVYVLATSSLVTGEVDRLERRHDEGLARRTEAELERDLSRAHHDLDEFEAHLDAPRARRRDSRHLERDIDRIDAEVERLCRIQEDIRRHREASWRRQRHLSREERERAAAADRDLTAWEREIDERAERLRARADQLKSTVRALERPFGAMD